MGFMRLLLGLFIMSAEALVPVTALLFICLVVVRMYFIQNTSQSTNKLKGCFFYTQENIYK